MTNNKVTYCIYSNDFEKENMAINKIQNKILLQTFLKKISQSDDYDSEFKSFIDYILPTQNVSNMSNQEIQNKIQYLSNVCNILEDEEFSNKEILTDMLEGISQKIFPHFVEKYTKYTFIVNQLDRYLKRIIKIYQSE